MKSSLLLLGVGVVLALVVFASDPGRASRLAAEAATSPQAASSNLAQTTPAAAQDDAAVGQLVLQRCGGCHSLDRLQQNPQDAAGWTQTIAQMEQLGAQLGPNEEPLIVAYLVRHFGK